jgi:hypothetical protein
VVEAGHNFRRFQYLSYVFRYLPPAGEREPEAVVPRKCLKLGLLNGRGCIGESTVDLRLTGKL